MALSRRQHYIPRFYLRSFAATPLGEAIWVYLRSGRRWERRTTRGIGWCRDIYTVSGSSGKRTDSFERLLGEEVEAPASPALRKAAETPEVLTVHEREAIAVFMAVTFARTPAILGADGPGGRGQRAAEEDHDTNDAPLQPAVLDRLAAFEAIPMWAASFRDRVVEWDWHFIRTTREAPFVTSDCPVYAERDQTGAMCFVQFPIATEVALVAHNTGVLRTDRDPRRDTEAINRGTLQRAREFVVSCSPSFPGDACLRAWSQRDQ